MQDCCNGEKVVFGVCNNVATGKKWFLAFATMLQAFPKHFGRYSALSKTFFRDKKPHSYVELTLGYIEALQKC